MTLARRRSSWRRSWPVLALLLALSCLGHGAVVAAGNDAPASARSSAIVPNDLPEMFDPAGPDRPGAGHCEPGARFSAGAAPDRAAAWSASSAPAAAVESGAAMVPLLTTDPPSPAGRDRLALLQSLLI